MTTTSAPLETTATTSVDTAAAVTHEPSIITSMAPLALILAVFYMLIIRPQQKKMQEHQKTVSTLKAGDKVVMNSGIIGSIIKADATDPEATLEIAKDVHIKIRKDMVTEIISAPQAIEKKSVSAAAKPIKPMAKPAAKPVAKKTAKNKTK